VKLEKFRNHFNVADVRNLAEDAGVVAQKSCHHSLGNQVFSATNVYATNQWLSALNGDLAH
jgi:hypothetical protein